MTLTDSDLPGVWKDADTDSGRGQNLTLRLTRLKVVGSLLAAIGGTLLWSIGQVDISGWIILIGFLIALVSELVSWEIKPERRWYEGRAVAESAKTLAWRYAVGADPFPVTMQRKDAEQIFRQRMSEVADQVSEVVVFDANNPAITPTMDALRNRPFEERRDAYIKSRTTQQKVWYATKARINQRQARVWRTVLIVAEVAAVILAAGRIFGDWRIDFAGLLASLITAATAWVAVKQFSPLGSAYSVATKELGIQESKLASVEEKDWALVAGDAEEAISREHTTWLASRTGKSAYRL